MRDSLAAGEGAGTECGDGEGAEAACSGAWSRGAAPTQSGRREPGHRWYYRCSRCHGYAISLRTLVVPRGPYIRCSAGRCLRRCRRLHRASARHTRYSVTSAAQRGTKPGPPGCSGFAQAPLRLCSGAAQPRLRVKQRLLRVEALTGAGKKLSYVRLLGYWAIRLFFWCPSQYYRSYTGATHPPLTHCSPSSPSTQGTFPLFF